MNEEQTKSFIMKLLKNKEEVLDTFQNDLNQCITMVNGVTKIIDDIDNCNEATLRKFLKTTMKANRNLAQMIQRITTLMMIYVGSDEFSSAVGKIAIRMGNGKEALQEMLRRKMAGNF